MGCFESKPRVEIAYWTYSYATWRTFMKQNGAEAPPEETEYKGGVFTVLGYEVTLGEDFLSFGRRLQSVEAKGDKTQATASRSAFFEGQELEFSEGGSGRLVRLHHVALDQGRSMDGDSAEYELRVVFTDDENHIGQVHVPVPRTEVAAAERAVEKWKPLCVPFYHQGREVREHEWKQLLIDMMVMDLMFSLTFCAVLNASMMPMDPMMDGYDDGGMGDAAADEGPGIMDFLL